MQPISKVDFEGRECTLCGVYKTWDNFTKGDAAYKKASRCKECAAKLRKEFRANHPRRHEENCKKYEKTKNGYLMRTYRNMLSRVNGTLKKKAHLYEGLPILDKDLFYFWSKNNPDFNYLFEEYERSGFDLKSAPSIDRKDSLRGYTLDNIRWITFSENSRLGSISKHSGRNT